MSLAPGTLFSLLAFGVLLIVASVTIWQWHRNPAYKQFSLLDLLVDDGKLSARKFFETGAFFVSSTGFVVLAVRGQMTEFYFTGYCAAWIAARTAGQIVHARAEAAAHDKPAQ